MHNEINKQIKEKIIVTLKNWKPPENWQVIESIEAHTGGEPLRIFTSGLPEIKGDTVLEKRRYFRENYDYIRTGTMWEPRGHADMYGAIVTAPNNEDADVGLFFLHNEGYSTMCGHAIIAISKVLLDTGWLVKEGDYPELKIDVPAGRIVATAFREHGVVREVSFFNVPSFLYKQDLEIDIPGIGNLKYDIAFGGAFYVFCRAEDLKVDLKPDQHDQLIHLGRTIKNCVMEKEEIVHPFEPDLSFLYGTIIVGPAKTAGHHSRNVCIFAEGQVDRSSTGSGVSARAALHFSKGELKSGESITIESILGTCMNVEVHEVTEFGGFEAVIPKVSGSAAICGQNRFYFDPDDPLNNGFIFR